MAVAADHNVIPVTETFIADTETPVSAFLKLRGTGPAFLLESAEQGQRVGRWSFIGVEPERSGDEPSGGGRGEARARERIAEVRERLAGALPRPEPHPERPEPHFEPNMPRETFEAMVARIVEYVHAGDAFQVVPSQRWSAPSPVESFSIYRGLRAVNPSPYMYFLD